MTAFLDRTLGRLSSRPAVAAFVAGLLLHVVEQVLVYRAGPLSVMVAAPVVATLAFLHLRATAYRGVAALTLWGALSTAAGIVVLYLATVNYTLPRAMTRSEMVAYDFGLFCWFVLSLAGVYVVAAKKGRRGQLLLLVAPFLQGAFAGVMRILVVTGLYA